MWQSKILKLNPQIKQTIAAIERGQPQTVNLTIKGSKIGLHNWTHGIKTASGRYLSPENAIKVVISKFNDESDSNRPTGSVDIVAFLVAEQQIDTFITKIEQINVLMPDPVLKQALDYAKSQRNLSESKMQKMPVIGYPSFSPNADITPGSARVMTSIMRNANAVASATKSDPSSQLNLLLAKKAERERENKKIVNKMLNTNVELYAFVATAPLSQIALSLLNNAPDVSHIYTSLIVFVGTDLGALRGMLYDR